MKRIFIIGALVLFAFSSGAQHRSYPVNESPNPSEGIVYNLPKTQFLVHIEAIKTEITPGPYYLYAERFLGIREVAKTAHTSYALKSVRIQAQSIADPEQQFALHPSGKSKTRQAIQLDAKGCLQSIGTTLSTVTSVPIKDSDRKKIKKQTAKRYTEADLITRDMQQASSTARMAELAATEIFNIRNARMHLLAQDSEQTPQDGTSYRIVLEELNAMEMAYMELFLGKKVLYHEQKQIRIDPETIKDPIIFRFSPQQGLVDKADLSGQPYYLQMDITPTQLSTTYESKSKPEPVGIYYRKPASTFVQLTDANQQVWFEKTFEIPQFGQVRSLPESMSKTVQLCTETGQLIQAAYE